MIYFDTAYIAKCYLSEDGCEEVRQLAAGGERIASCAFARLELAATVHRSLREKRITAAQYEWTVRQIDFDEDQGVWIWLPLTQGLLALAAETYRKLKPSIFLRAADALHLACAAENGFAEIYTNDRHLLAAAAGFGVKGRNVIS